MPRNRGTVDSDEEDDFDDPEDPEPIDQDDDDEPDEFTCPYCGAGIFESTDVCPKCRSFISIEDAPRTNEPRWVVWVAIALILAIVLGAFGLIHFF